MCSLIYSHLRLLFILFRPPPDLDREPASARVVVDGVVRPIAASVRSFFWAASFRGFFSASGAIIFSVRFLVRWLTYVVGDVSAEHITAEHVPAATDFDL